MYIDYSLDETTYFKDGDENSKKREKRCSLSYLNETNPFCKVSSIMHRLIIDVVLLTDFNFTYAITEYSGKVMYFLTLNGIFSLIKIKYSTVYRCFMQYSSSYVHVKTITLNQVLNSSDDSTVSPLKYGCNYFFVLLTIFLISSL